MSRIFVGAYVRIITDLTPQAVMKGLSSLEYANKTDNGFIAFVKDDRVVEAKTDTVCSISNTKIERSLREFENICAGNLSYLRNLLGVQNVIVDYGVLTITKE